jgi:hypothetical protein
LHPKWIRQSVDAFFQRRAAYLLQDKLSVHLKEDNATLVHRLKVRLIATQLATLLVFRYFTEEYRYHKIRS